MSELDWTIALKGDVLINGRSVSLTRRQFGSALPLGAARASVHVAPGGSLRGLTDLKRPGPVLTEGEARRSAFEFLAGVALNLELTDLWIDPHEDSALTDGHFEAIVGQKVKCPSDRRYASAVVGDGCSPSRATSIGMTQCALAARSDGCTTIGFDTGSWRGG